MAKLSDLHPKVRRAKVLEALNGVLRQIDAPTSTGEIVHRVAEFMALDRDDQNLAARYIVEATRTHNLAHLTGETFVKYGKVMKRWEWLPSHAKPAANTPIRLSDGERARRRAEIARLEADDDWSIPAPGDFLEDEQ